MELVNDLSDLLDAPPSPTEAYDQLKIAILLCTTESARGRVRGS